MEDILQNQEELNQPQASEANRKKSIKIILIGFTEIILIAGSFYAGLRYSENKGPRDLTPLPAPTVANQQPTKSPEVTPTSKVESTITWRKFGENKAISFDYPNGWHIYSGWFEKEGDPIKIFLSPEPLDGAPRGGSASVIIIEDYSGNENPNAILERNLSRSRGEITIDVKETSFIIGDKKVYKIEGKRNAFQSIETIIQYHTLLKGDNTDNLNTHVIKASLTLLSDDERLQEYSEILDRLVRSLKHRDQK